MIVDEDENDVWLLRFLGERGSQNCKLENENCKMGGDSGVKKSSVSWGFILHFKI
tara:strand:- start:384 stop:548 length:165 start_codon:yes stop_codon:yes gene_type:complete